MSIWRTVYARDDERRWVVDGIDERGGPPITGRVPEIGCVSIHMSAAECVFR